MNRRELMQRVKELGLQEEVEKISGVNWTRSKTEVYEQVIWNYDCTLVDKDSNQVEHDGSDDEVDWDKEDEIVTKSAYTTDTDDAFEAACMAFIGILKDSDKLDEILAKL